VDNVDRSGGETFDGSALIRSPQCRSRLYKIADDGYMKAWAMGRENTPICAYSGREMASGFAAWRGRETAPAVNP
jgi:hypothetical protein